MAGTGQGRVALRSTLTTAVMAGALASLSPAGAEGSAGTEPAKLSQVTVLIQGFRNERGEALLALFRHADEFPREPERAELRELTRIEHGQARFVLTGLKPGDFALSVLHDEDGDRKVKTGLFGIPREGIGFSRDARGMFGPPKFENARLSLAPGVNLTVTIRMHYY